MREGGLVSGDGMREVKSGTREGELVGGGKREGVNWWVVGRSELVGGGKVDW